MPITKLIMQSNIALFSKFTKKIVFVILKAETKQILTVKSIAVTFGQ